MNRLFLIGAICGLVVSGVGASFSASAQPACDPEEIAKMLASDGQADDEFGFSLSMDGDVAIIGAFLDDDNGAESGSAYVYRFDGDSWIEEAKLTASDGSAGDLFGGAVSISGDVALVGAHGDDARGDRSGSAYIFRYDDDSWNEAAKLIASDGSHDDLFGLSVQIDGEVALVGAFWDDDNGYNSGSCYVYRYVGAAWIEEAKLTASDGEAEDFFGMSVSLDGDVALIGAGYDDDLGLDSGSAYIFRYNGDSWNEEAKLTPSDGEVRDTFGSAVSISGNYALIGSYQDDDQGDLSGSAYLYYFNGDSWNNETKLLPLDGVAEDNFGNSVSIDGNVAVIGARRDDDNGTDSGSAYVYRYDGDTWNEEMKIAASDAAAEDYFASRVYVNGNVALIGAYATDDNGTNSGSAYVFDLDCDCLSLAVENLVAGDLATFTVSHGTPGTKGVTVYGLQAGTTNVNDVSGFCATFQIQGVTPNRIVGGLNRIFDSNGEIQFDVFIPGAAQGRTLYFQSAQRDTCPDECMSNLIEVTVN